MIPLGFTSYALIGAGVIAIGAAGYGAYQHQRANAADARADLAEHVAAQLKESLAESEAAQAALREASKRLDEAVRERDKRLAELLRAKRNLTDEYNRIKKTLAEADQNCLDRDLPDALVERLRIDRAVDGDKDGAAKSPGGPALPVPHLGAGS